eukprot:2590015-Amphidinium_carterae.1
MDKVADWCLEQRGDKRQQPNVQWAEDACAKVLPQLRLHVESGDFDGAWDCINAGLSLMEAGSCLYRKDARPAYRTATLHQFM